MRLLAEDLVVALLAVGELELVVLHLVTVRVRVRVGLTQTLGYNPNPNPNPNPSPNPNPTPNPPPRPWRCARRPRAGAVRRAARCRAGGRGTLLASGVGLGVGRVRGQR